jgi:sugar phosphate isomerase/epimerase
MVAQSPLPQSAPLELGAFTQLYRAYAFDVALERLAQAGFRAIGVSTRHAGVTIITPDTTRHELDNLRRRIEAFGLRPRLIGGFAPQAGDPAVAMRRSVQVAATLGCPFVTSHAPSPYADQPFGQRKRAMLQYEEAAAYLAALRDVAPLAEQSGVTIVLKPHSGITGTGADLADIVRLLDHPAVQVCYDAGNIAFFEGVDPAEDVVACAADVRVVAIKDHRGGPGNEQVPIPGAGIVDHERLFRALLAAGFAGPCLIERIDGYDQAEAMDAALATARANLERAFAAASASVFSSG